MARDGSRKRKRDKASMHPLNKYAENPPDFNFLASHCPSFKEWIPDRQLCPTVPNRANYIHWIQDLLTNFPAPWHTIDKDSIWGLDIGTGANCIYPLLGAAIHGWHFVGTGVIEGDYNVFKRGGSLQDNLERQHKDGRLQEALPSGENNAGHFTITVFEQAPGALLVKGKLAKEKSLLTGNFNAMLSCIEQRLKHLFCAKKEQIS
ncbi:hypothetical protein L7F22_051582 [Adiantum nelumboides]|nr:hypothetical protein [Adiantum nelumboides]